MDLVFYSFDFGWKNSFFILFLWLVFCGYLFYRYKLNRIYFFVFCILETLIAYAYNLYFGMCFGILFGMMLILSFLDIKYLAVPVLWNFFFALFASIFVFVDELWLNRFLDAFALVGIFALLQNFGRYVLKKEVVGDGDIVFLFGFCFVFGIYGSLYAIFLGSLMGVLFAYIGKKSKKMPFITLMVLGIVLEFMIGLANV